MGKGGRASVPWRLSLKLAGEFPFFKNADSKCMSWGFVSVRILLKNIKTLDIQLSSKEKLTRFCYTLDLC